MATTRPVVPRQPRGGGGEAVVVGVKKQQNQNVAAGDASNRRPLGDIGNLLAAVRGADGKPLPQRPLTRSFCAQLIANAQAAAAADKNKKQVCVNNVEREEVAVDGAVVANKRAPAPKPAQKKATVKPPPPKTEEVVEISPDVSEFNNKQDKLENDNKKEAERSLKNKCQPTLSSVLTARSKAACGLPNKPKNIIDIDAADANNDLAEVEYVEDIYKYYKEVENDSRPNNKYMDSQPEINKKMRAILVDWLIDVHTKFDLSPETLYLTINILDRFLSVKKVLRREFQLVGMSAMLIASKYEEIWPLEVNDLVCVSNGTYSHEQVLVMEKTILGELEWTLTVPTHYVFLARFIKASIPDKELENNMVYFLAELGLMHYDLTIMFSPSMVAASAVYAARCTLLKVPSWTDTLELHTGFSELQLRECAGMLVYLHSKAQENKLHSVFSKYSRVEEEEEEEAASENKLLSVYKKYSHLDRDEVAYRPPAPPLLAWWW